MNYFEESEFSEFNYKMKERFEEKKDEKIDYLQMAEIDKAGTIEDLLSSATKKWNKVMNAEEINEVRKHLVDMENYCRMLHTLLS